MNDTTHPLTQPKKSKRLLWGLLAAVAGLITVATVTHAAMGHGPFAGFHSAFVGGQIDPARAAKHVEKAVTWVLSDVDATADQKAQVTQVFQTALNDLLPLREQHQSAHQQILELMSQPTVDRAALEKIRASQIELVNTASKRLTTALADAADVLTPEQRAKLIELHHRNDG